MKLRAQHRSMDVRFSVTDPPSWSALVERWYQLDAPAFALAEAWTQWNRAGDLPMPTFVVGASAGASNESDREFAQSSRANRFVHTLPSVRYTALCQVMRWHGPLLCVQRGATTLAAGLATALDLHEGDGESWVLGAHPSPGGAVVDFFRLGIRVPGRYFLERRDGAAVPSDPVLRENLARGAAAQLEGGWCLVTH